MSQIQAVPPGSALAWLRQSLHHQGDPRAQCRVPGPPAFFAWCFFSQMQGSGLSFSALVTLIGDSLIALPTRCPQNCSRTTFFE